MTHHRPFGTTGLSFFPLGLGTVWFGRQWPPHNTDYQSPTCQEIYRHLVTAYKIMGNRDRVVMIDTAAAYGGGEIFIGDFLRDNPQYVSQSFIATKWGEDFDIETGVSSVDHSIAHLRHSFERSRQRLGRIDLLYLHKTGASVLFDHSVIEAMARIKKEGGVRFLGASISDGSVLELAVEQNLLKPFDAIQMPASLFLEKPNLIEALYKTGKAIVLNSPIRKSDKKDSAACYRALLNQPQVSMILTGTRNHLEETVKHINPPCQPV